MARQPTSEVEIRPPEGLRATSIVLADSEYVLLSFSSSLWQLPDSLTPAEQEVACALLEGATNEDIALRRSTALRTVANQIAAIFRKLEVNSRLELACKLTRHGAPVTVSHAMP